MIAPIPVTILTGFLGAGKTTLLNRLLRGIHSRRLAVIVNDFGSINIDAALVDRVEGEMMSLTNGCICCDRSADLRGMVQRLLAGNPPEHILVESSGVSDPVAVAATFRRAEFRDRFRLDAIVTVVDAERMNDPRLDRQLIHDQIAVADLVVVNKIDLVTGTTRKDCRAAIRGIAPQARIVETVEADVPLALLLGATFAERERPAEAHHTEHSERYQTWAYTTDSPLDLHRALETLKALPPHIVRAKGIVTFADAPGMKIAVQVVGRRVTSDVLGRWTGEVPHSTLVFIAFDSPVPLDALRPLLDACRVGIPAGI